MMSRSRPLATSSFERMKSSRCPALREAGLRMPFATTRTLPCSGVRSVSIRSASPKSLRRRTMASVRYVRSRAGTPAIIAEGPLRGPLQHHDFPRPRGFLFREAHPRGLGGGGDLPGIVDVDAEARAGEAHP